MQKSRIMKKIAILVLLLVSIISCKKDDQCPTEDFTGTYIGNAECLLGLTNQEDIMVVVARRDDKTLEIEFLDNVLIFDIKGCELDVDDNVSLGTGTTGSAIIADGKITLNYQKKVAGILTEECDFEGMKM